MARSGEWITHQEIGAFADLEPSDFYLVRRYRALPSCEIKHVAHSERGSFVCAALTALIRNPAIFERVRNVCAGLGVQADP